MASKPRVGWQTAAEAAKVGLSSSGRLCLADFGFDGEESDEEGVCVRDSSPDSVTISPRPRAGPPAVALVGGTGCLTNREQFRCEVRSPNDEVCFCDEDDEPVGEVACEVRGQRIELDLELAKAQQHMPRPARRELSPPRKHKDRKSKIDCGERHVTLIAPAIVSKIESAEPAERDEARIAADLRLLRNSGGARSIAMVPAPLRQSVRTDSDEIVDQDKARRRAERKAAKQAEKHLMSQEPIRQRAAGVLIEQSIKEQLLAEQAKASRRAARKAAKEAAQPPGIEEATTAEQHIGDTVAAARDAWAEGPGCQQH